MDFEVVYSIIFWIPRLCHLICTFYLSFFIFSWRALPFEISFLHLPYCFYLCSPILLFFLTIARRTTILCLSTLCVHLVFVWLAFWSTNILYYLPTFFISRYLIWSHLLSKNLYLAESKTNDLVNNNGVSLAENVNWYKKVWKKLGSCKLGIKFLLVAWLKKTICCSSHIHVTLRNHNSLLEFIANASIIFRFVLFCWEQVSIKRLFYIQMDGVFKTICQLHFNFYNSSVNNISYLKSNTKVISVYYGLIIFRYSNLLKYLNALF